MINAWSLLYEELNGTMDDTYPLKKRDKMTDKNKDDVTLLGGDSGTVTFTVPEDAVGAADTISIDFGDTNPDTLNFGTPFPGGMGEDHISISGYSGTAYDDPKYYAMDFGDDPYPTIGAVHDAIGLGNTASAEYGFPPKPRPNSDVKLDIKLSEWERIEKPQPNLKDGSNQKYQEDKGIAALKSYVASTYKGHYTNENSDVQTLDLIHSVGDAESFCRSNALKYLSRYDKKGSAKKDILKAMHYCLLLYYFSGNTQEPDYTNTRYETF